MTTARDREKAPTPGTVGLGPADRKVHRVKSGPLEYGGFLLHEIRRAESAPPIEVPRCLDRKTYIAHFIESQPD